jgi:hypothetical protein
VAPVADKVGAGLWPKEARFGLGRKKKGRKIRDKAGKNEER